MKLDVFDFDMKCEFIKQNGIKCGAYAIRNTDLCFSHNPEYEVAKAVAVRNGGLNRRLYGVYGGTLSLETADDIKKLLSDTINKVWTGEMPASQPANTIGFLARCWLTAHQEGKTLSEIQEIKVSVTDYKT